MDDPHIHGDDTTSSLRHDWIAAQDSLKTKLILEDDFTWTVPSGESSSSEVRSGTENLKYVGGVDVSYLKDDPSTACAALVIVDADTLNVVHEVFEVARLRVPYVPGFLAFRELLMVDGNGLLHPRGFGLACHLGVLANLPTIGIGKNLHHVDGLTQAGVRQVLEAREKSNKDLISLVGKSGQVWGVAMCSVTASKPVYISVGHMISLDSSIKIVKFLSKFRVPEPIRQADIRSRAFLQKLKGSLHVEN